MKYDRLALSLAFFIPAFMLLAVWRSADHWQGCVVGGIIGLGFGLVFGRFRPSWLEMMYPRIDE